jgi:hypothetical protein
MRQIKWWILPVVAAFAIILPVGAAQVRSQNVGTDTVIGEDGQVNEVTERTGDYVRNKIEEMKALQEAQKAAAKEEVLEKVRKRVVAMIENAVRRYEKVQTQVTNAEGLTEEEKTGIQEKITAQLEVMTNLKATVEEAETVAELKEAMTQVKSRFKLSLGLVRQAVSGVYGDRLDNILTKISGVYDKLNTKVEALADGEEKTELQALLSEAQVSLSGAKTYIDANDFIKAKGNLTNAHENLTEVADSLRN